MRSVAGISRQCELQSLAGLLASVTLNATGLSEEWADTCVTERIGAPAAKLLKHIGQKDENAQIVMRAPETDGPVRLWLDDASVLQTLYGSATEFKPSLAYTPCHAVNRYLDSFLHNDSPELAAWILEQYLADYKERISKLESGDKWTNWEWTDVMEFHQTLSPAVDIPALTNLRKVKPWTSTDLKLEELFAANNLGKTEAEARAELIAHEAGVTVVLMELKKRCQILEDLLKNGNFSNNKNNLNQIANSLLKISNNSLAPVFGKKSAKSIKLGLANVCDTAYECSGAEFLNYSGIKHTDVIQRKLGLKQSVCFLSGLIVDKDAGKIYENPVLLSMFEKMYRDPRVCSTVFKHMKNYGVPSSCASLLWGVSEPSLNWYTLGADAVHKMRGLWMKSWINYATARAVESLKNEIDSSKAAITGHEIMNIAMRLNLPKIDGRTSTLRDQLVKEFINFYGSINRQSKKVNSRSMQEKVASGVDQTLRQEKDSVFASLPAKKGINFMSHVEVRAIEPEVDCVSSAEKPIYETIDESDEHKLDEPEPSHETLKQVRRHRRHTNSWIEGQNPSSQSA